MTAIALVSSAAVAAPAAKVASKPAAKVTAPAPFAKGKGSDARCLAFGDVEVLGYIEGKSRGEVIASLRIALGKAPTPAQIDQCRAAYIVGRIAGKLMIEGDVAARLVNARDVLHRMASPAKDGVAARKLRKGQIGRRSIDQHKAVRAAEEAWSQIKAEVAPATSNASTQAQRNKAKRAPAMAGATARGKAGTGITHSELVKADGPMTRDAAATYISQMSATMLAFCNKHAAVMPTEYGASVRRFHAAIAELVKAG